MASDRPLGIDAPCLDINDARGIVDMVEIRFLKAKAKKSVKTGRLKNRTRGMRT